MGGINTGGQFQRPMMQMKTAIKKPVSTNQTNVTQNTAQTAAPAKTAPPPKQAAANANLKTIQSDQMKAEVKETLQGEPTEKSLELPLLDQEIPETPDLPESDSNSVSETDTSQPEVAETEAPQETEKPEETTEPEATTETAEPEAETEVEAEAEVEETEEPEESSDSSESVESEAPKVDEQQPEVQEKEEEPEQEQDKGQEKEKDQQQDQEREGGRGGQQQEKQEQGKQQEQPQQQEPEKEQPKDQNKDQNKDQSQDQPKDQGRDPQQGGQQQSGGQSGQQSFQQQGQQGRSSQPSTDTDSSESDTQEIGSIEPASASSMSSSITRPVNPTTVRKEPLSVPGVQASPSSIPDAPPLPSFMQASFGGPSPSKPSTGGITADALQQAKSKLVPVSQNAVLTLGKELYDDHGMPTSSDSGKMDTTVIRSGQSLRAKTGASVFDRDLPPGEKGTLSVVGHGVERVNAQGQSEYLIGDQTPQQLVAILKDAGIQKLDTLSLKSCHSTAFMKEVAVELKQAGIEVKQIEGFDTRIAIDEKTGQVLTETNGINLEQVQGHSGTLNDLQTAQSCISQGNIVGAANIVVNMLKNNQVSEAHKVLALLAKEGQWGAIQEISINAVHFFQQNPQEFMSQLWGTLVDEQIRNKSNTDTLKEAVYCFAGICDKIGNTKGLIDSALLLQRVDPQTDISKLLAKSSELSIQNKDAHSLLRIATMLPTDQMTKKIELAHQVFQLSLQSNNLLTGLKTIEFLQENTPSNQINNQKLFLKYTVQILEASKEVGLPDISLQALHFLQEQSFTYSTEVLNSEFSSVQSLQSYLMGSAIEIAQSQKFINPHTALNALYSIQELSMHISPENTALALNKVLNLQPSEQITKETANSQLLNFVADKGQNIVIELSKQAVSPEVNQAKLETLAFLNDIVPNQPKIVQELLNTNQSILINTQDHDAQLGALRNIIEISNRFSDDFLSKLSPQQTQKSLKESCQKLLTESFFPQVEKSKNPTLLLNGARVLIELSPSDPNAVTYAVKIISNMSSLTKDPALKLDSAEFLNDLILFAPIDQHNALREVVSKVCLDVIQEGLQSEESEFVLQSAQLLHELLPNIPPEKQGEALQTIVNTTVQSSTLALKTDDPETALSATQFLHELLPNIPSEKQGEVLQTIVNTTVQASTLALKTGDPETALSAAQLLHDLRPNIPSEKQDEVLQIIVNTTVQASVLALKTGDSGTALRAAQLLHELLPDISPEKQDEALQIIVNTTVQASALALADREFELSIDCAQFLVDCGKLDSAKGILDQVQSTASLPKFEGIESELTLNLNTNDTNYFDKSSIVLYDPAGKNSLSVEENQKLQLFTEAVRNCVKDSYSHLKNGDFPSSDVYNAQKFVLKGHSLAAAKLGYTIESQVMAALQNNSSLDSSTGLFKFPKNEQDPNKAIFWKSQGSVNLPKSTRPDIFIVMNPNDPSSKREALIDLTSHKQKGHIITGKSPNWLSRNNIVFVREVTYPTLDKGIIQAMRNSLIRGGNKGSDAFKLSNALAITQSQLDRGINARQKEAETNFIRKIAANFSGKGFADTFFNGNMTDAKKFMQIYGVSKKGLTGGTKSGANEAKELKKTFAKHLTTKNQILTQTVLTQLNLSSTPFERYEP